MENNQSTQQSSGLDYSEVTQSSHRHTPGNKNFLIAIFRHYPWLIWGGMWLLLLLISVASIISLTHPPGVEPEEPQQKPVVVEKPTKISPQTDRTLPLLVLSAAAFTLTAGSLVIIKFRYSKARSPKRSLTRRQQRKLMLEAQAATTQSEPLTPPAPTPAAQSGVTVQASEKPLNAAEVIEVLDNSLLSTANNSTQNNDLKPEEPLVTVLPPEENDLADVGEESLAEKMDIRKHRSLSSILQDS